MYTIVLVIKVKHTFKVGFNCFNRSFKFTIRKVMLLCC